MAVGIGMEVFVLFSCAVIKQKQNKPCLNYPRVSIERDLCRFQSFSGTVVTQWDWPSGGARDSAG